MKHKYKRLKLNRYFEISSFVLSGERYILVDMYDLKGKFALLPVEQAIKVMKDRDIAIDLIIELSNALGEYDRDARDKIMNKARQ